MLPVTDLGKKMKKRVNLVKKWLQAAENDYQEDRKEEGEINLLLAQAEARRAWELSCQEKNKFLSSKKRNFFWPLLACLGVFLFLGTFLSYSHSFQTTPPIKKEIPSVSTIEVDKATLKKEKIPLENVEVKQEGKKAEEYPHPKKEEKTVVREKTVSPQEQPMEVDMSDLVQEAQKILYQNGANMQIEKEAN